MGTRKICIIGYSGAGKSTLAAALGRRYGLPVLHLDQVQFLPGWKSRPAAEQRAAVEGFLNANAGWVIDGNYTNLSYARRMAEADRIYFLDFGRFPCLVRVLARYLDNRGQSRASMAAGCPEKIDAEFLWWVLYKGRTAQKRAEYRALCAQYPAKVTILRTQRALDGVLGR